MSEVVKLSLEGCWDVAITLSTPMRFKLTCPYDPAIRPETHSVLLEGFGISPNPRPGKITAVAHHHPKPPRWVDDSLLGFSGRGYEDLGHKGWTDLEGTVEVLEDQDTTEKPEDPPKPRYCPYCGYEGLEVLPYDRGIEPPGWNCQCTRCGWQAYIEQ